LRVAVAFAGIVDGSTLAAASLTGFGGVISKFPSLGGVERLMNSILVGSLAAARRSTVSSW